MCRPRDIRTVSRAIAASQPRDGVPSLAASPEESLLVCPNCAAEVRLGQKFCFSCGLALGRTCAECGASLVDDARFCGECGTPVPTATGAAIAAPMKARPTSASPNGPSSAPAPVAERRLVSVLFADLVGFTTYSEARDAEEVRELLSSYFETARDVIGKYGGTIEKFIGDAVMAVWGAPTAFEDDAERAVRAAIDMVAAVQDLGRLRDIPELALRAGVLPGEAAVTIGATGQGMVAGDLVNTASRLQSVAPPGTVLVGEATYRASKDAVAFEAVGEQALKGKALPVPAWRAMRVTAKRGGIGRKEEIEAPFVGRDEELRLLKELLHSTARERRTRLVSVVGLAGLGKSRLAWEFLKYIDGLIEDIYWHQGRSLPYGEGVTFWALGEMVRRRAGIAETDDTATTSAKLTATLADYLPDEAERRWVEPRLAHLLGLQESPTGEREELFAAWRTFFERVSQRGPVILVFEDCQWADNGLLDFVEYVLEWSRTYPIFIVTLSRPDLLERRPSWGAGQRNFTGIRLEPLDARAVRDLLAGLAPGLPEAIGEQTLQRADGVPLYAVETVRMLADQGLLTPADGSYRPTPELTSVGPRELAIPETLQALIAARLDSLDASDRSLLQDASVLGQTFTLDALAAITGESADQLESRLRVLVRREVLVLDADPRSPERGQYGFGQAILREIAYGTLSKADRRAMHVAAARYWESLGDEELAGVLASHYLDAYRATPAGPEADALAAQARVALRGAAERAVALHSHEQALAYYEQALTVAKEPDDRAAIMEAAATAARSAARFQDAERYLQAVIEQARASGDRPLQARASARLATITGYTRSAKEAIAFAESALAELGDLQADPGVIDLTAELARGYYLAEDKPKAIELADRALRAAERQGLVRVITETLITKGSTMAATDQPREGTALLRGALSLAEHNGLLSEQLRAINNISALLIADDPTEALAVARSGIDLLRRLGMREWLPLYGNATTSAFLSGDWDLALQLHDELDPEQIGTFAKVEAQVASASVLSLRGLTEKADRRLELAREAETEGPEDTQVAANMRLGEAFRALAAGDLRTAFAKGAEAGRVTHIAVYWAIGCDVAARAALWMRDADRARKALLAFEEVPFRGVWIDTALATVRAGVAGLEGRRQDAVAGYQDVVRVWRERGWLPGLAFAQLEAAMFLGQEDPLGRAAAEDARDVLTRLGAAPLLARLDAAVQTAPAHARPIRAREALPAS